LFVTLALSANQKEVKILAVRALVQLFKLSFGTSRWAQTIHVYHHLSHLATTEDNGAKRESLAMLLSLRSNEAGQPFYLDHQNSSIVVDLFLSFDHSSDASNIQLLSSPTSLKSTQFVSTSTSTPFLPSTSLFNNLVGRLAKEDCPEVLLLILRGLRSLLRGFNVPRGSIHKIVPALSRLPKEKIFITGFFEAASKKLKEECLELAYDLLLLSIGYAHYWQITAQEEENREALVVCFENTCSTLKWGPNFAWLNHVSFELISSLQRRTFNAFSICNAELPLTMRRHISTILKFLGQLFFSSEGSLILIDFAGEVVEYFRSLASSSSLLSAITVTDYSFIFRILLFLVEDVKTTSYLLHMTFRSLAHWLAVCPVSIRQQHYYTIKSSAARFAANHEDKKTLVESYVDLMATYAFSDVETSSSVKNDFPSIIFSEYTKYWLLGNAILSIRTGKLGWAEVTVRRPSGIMTWVLQIRNKLQSVRNKHEGNGSHLGNKKLPQSPTSPTSPTSPNQSYINFNHLSSTTSPNSSINSSFDQSSVKPPQTEVFKSFSILDDTSLMVDLSLINDTSGRKRKDSSAAQHQHAHTSRAPVSTPPLSPPSFHTPLPTLLSATTSSSSLPTSLATHTPSSSSPPPSKSESLVPALNLDLTSTTQILLQQDQPPPSKSVFIQSAKRHGQIVHRRAVSISTPPSVSSEAGSREDSQANKPDLLTLFYPPLPSYEGEDLHSPSFFYPTIPVASNPMICQNRLSIEAQMRLHSSFSSESSSLSDVSNPSSLSESFERNNSLPSSSTFHPKHTPLIPVTEHPLMEPGERRENESSLIPQTKRTPSSTFLVSTQHQQPEKAGGSGGDFHHTSHTHEKEDDHHTHYPLSSTASSSSLLQTLEEKTSSENILAAIASTEHHANAHPPTHLRRGSRDDILTGFASSTLKVVSELPSVIPEQERSRSGGSLLELGGGGEDDDEALVLGDPVDDINPNFIFLQLHQIPFMNEKLLALKPTEGLERAIKCIDLIHSFESHKIGLIYVAENQTKEEEILANVQGSLRYSSFLKSMGEIVRLKDCVDIYVAGLDR
jgi:hypothetical protein